MSTGIAIWSIVLTIIAMYVAGRETERLAGITTRHDGIIHGLIMFSVCRWLAWWLWSASEEAY